jgi:hypothetical protein
MIANKVALPDSPTLTELCAQLSTAAADLTARRWGGRTGLCGEYGVYGGFSIAMGRTGLG